LTLEFIGSYGRSDNVRQKTEIEMAAYIKFDGIDGEALDKDHEK